jgi:hypothetical protein
VAWVHSADIDGDGDLDIVAGLRNEVRTLWYENLGGSPPVFVEHTVFDEPSGPPRSHEPPPTSTAMETSMWSPA